MERSRYRTLPALKQIESWKRFIKIEILFIFAPSKWVTIFKGAKISFQNKTSQKRKQLHYKLREGNEWNIRG